MYERLWNSPIGKRIVRGTIWSVVGVVLGKGLTFVSLLLVARILGVHVYGELGVILSTVTAFAGFSRFGAGVTATTYIAANLENDKPRVGRIIGLCYLVTFLISLPAAAAVYVAAPLLCDSPLLHHSTHLTQELRLSGIAIVFITLMGTQSGVLAGFQDFRGLALANAVSGLIAVPIYLAYTYRYGLAGAVASLGLTAFVNALINASVIFRNTKKHGIRYDFRNAWRESSVLWRQSLPIFLCTAVFCAATAASRFLIAASPNGFSELGLFSAAVQIETIMYVLPTILASVIQPIFSRVAMEKDWSKFRRIARLSVALNMGTALAFVLPFALFAEPIMALFGKDFPVGAPVLSLLCIGLVFHAGVKTTQAQCVSLNRMWGCFGVVFAYGAVQLALMYYFLSIGLGAAGAALAYSVSYAVYFFGTAITASVNLGDGCPTAS